MQQQGGTPSVPRKGLKLEPPSQLLKAVWLRREVAKLLPKPPRRSSLSVHRHVKGREKCPLGRAAWVLQQRVQLEVRAHEPLHLRPLSAAACTGVRLIPGLAS